MQTLLFCWLIFMRMIEMAKRLTQKKWLSVRLNRDWSMCHIVCMHVQTKIQKICSFLSLLSFKKVGIRILMKLKGHSSLYQRKAVQQILNWKTYLKKTEEPNFGTVTAINGYICCPVCKLCAKHSKSKLKDTSFNCSISFQLFYQWWATCLLMKNTSACQVIEKPS